MPQLNHFDYFSDIEKAFIRRRGKHLMIGPLDWSLIESWEKRGIPLRIVIQAIDEVFDSFEQRGEDKTTVRSLKYCNDSVERRFKDWSRAGVGKTDEQPSEEKGISESSIMAHIADRFAAFEKLKSGIPDTIAKALDEIREKVSGLSDADDETAEDDLDRLDEEVNALILNNKEDLINERLEAVVERKLNQYGIEPGSEAAKRIVCDAVRAEYGIPRLSLYEL